MPTNNGDIPINIAGYEFGQRAFNSFLLAGERYLGSGMQRENTDEARFARFFDQIPQERSAYLEGYFSRQRLLALPQRNLLLGSLTEISLNQPLTTENINRPLLSSAVIRNSLVDAFPDIHPIPPIGGGGGGGGTGNRVGYDEVGVLSPITGTSSVAIANAPVPKKFNLHLEEIQVQKGQDRFSLPFLGSFNETDEVTISVVTINDIGETLAVNHDLPDIKHQETKNFNDMKLCSFDVPSANATDADSLGFPRTFTAIVYAIERDDGGYNDFISAAADYAKEKVTEELISKGIIAAGEALGYPIPPQVAEFIASYVKGFFDKLVDWLKDVFTNNDDVLGQHSRAISLNSLATSFNNSQDKKSDTFTWQFSGEDGRWQTKMHWTLEATRGPVLAPV